MKTISNCCSAAKKNEYCLCPECHEHCDWMEECPDCDDGNVPKRCEYGNNFEIKMVTCQTCKGEGWVKI